ncbi:MAG: hypothetical protein QOK21_3073 [Solirubrobacteraceae bacterium]|nr:hypothetical protein [Solirubrobacteraceae bacterium]
MRRLWLAVLLAPAIWAAGAGSASALNVSATCVPAPSNCRGWYQEPVSVHWFPSSDARQATCDAVETVSNQGMANPTCTVSDSQELTVTRTLTFGIDWTPPIVTAAVPSRPPDAGGFYRAPVRVAFQGADATSGIAACTDIDYAGPDGDPAQVVGTCTDAAGNTSAPFGFAVRYDTSPPALAVPSARTGDRVVRLHWHVPADAVSIELLRSGGAKQAADKVLYRGRGTGFADRRVRNGRRYAYTVRATDAAGNVATATLAAIPRRRLLYPTGGAVVGARPVLRWTPVRGARYYNVQLYRGTHKLLSAWPRAAHYRLRASWRYAGTRHRLRPGAYRWYVWPGRGRPDDRRFGDRVGRGRFVVARG